MFGYRSVSRALFGHQCPRTATLRHLQMRRVPLGIDVGTGPRDLGYVIVGPSGPGLLSRGVRTAILLFGPGNIIPELETQDKIFGQARKGSDSVVFMG